MGTRLNCAVTRVPRAPEDRASWPGYTDPGWKGVFPGQGEVRAAETLLEFVRERLRLTGQVDLLLGGDGRLEWLDFKTSPRPVYSPALLASYERQLVHTPTFWKRATASGQTVCSCTGLLSHASKTRSWSALTGRHKSQPPAPILNRWWRKSSRKTSPCGHLRSLTSARSVTSAATVRGRGSSGSREMKHEQGYGPFMADQS
jgi:hypothetical protein